MPRPPTARRLDSLFDNRYRYDYIYPRGRSGETLRAYDTLNGDQPVVIKRPAPQDAPPIRAGQEVSILNEKRALEKLAGHPSLTELRHSGTFRVGGQAHQYIAMDMAHGEIVEAMVLELAAQGKRLPELEMLVIFDNLLDLLQTAHDRKIIYNDVDAKHLFWDRSHYRLKVIDWGNAVFLDSENVPPQVNRASDMLQIGQLLYFVVSGGKRLEVGHTDPAFDLGDDVSLKLKAIINRAANPEISGRYPDVAALRQDFAELRRPLEKSRDLTLDRARSRLASANSQEQFAQLRETLTEAMEPDPGYPPVRELLAEVENRLKELSIQGDLDAVRIYIESGNTVRAATLLEDLRSRLDTDQPILTYLLDVCEQLGTQVQLPLPAGLSPALDALMKGDAQAAGRLLVVTPEPRPDAQIQQLLLAERLTLIIPGVTLLRPHLARLAAQQPSHLIEIEEPTEPGIAALRRIYEHTADALVVLENDPVAERGRRAADDIVELLDVVAQNVLTDPTRAGNALWRAAAIDPVSQAFNALNDMLNDFHEMLDELSKVTPAPDGSTIGEFLTTTGAKLKRYVPEITDKQFVALVNGVDTAISSWTRAIDFIALGGRRPAVDSCKSAAEGIRALNGYMARWFEDNARKIEEAPRVEYLSPNVSLGRAVADGWENWDRGKAGEAKASGEKAASFARTDGEKLSARRLIDLSEALMTWLTIDGVSDATRTDQIEDRVSALLLPEEETIRHKFSAQMPNMQIYLKAMGRGIVEPMQDASAAAIRILFFHYVLRGILALSQEKPDDANFWKEAALRTFNNARTHPAFSALDNAITRRQLVIDAVKAINAIKYPADLAEARLTVRAPLAAGQLEYAEQAIRAVDEALRRWPDGEFRAARQQLDSAIELITNAEKVTGHDLKPFKSWVQNLADSAEILQQARRTIEQAALVPADDPDPAVMEAHQKLIDVTRHDLGESFTAQLKQWRDTYNAIRDIYVDEKLTKTEKLAQFEGHFASLFIDRQPALPIFRHWQSVVRLQPDQKPSYAESGESEDGAESGGTYIDNAPVDYDIQPMIRQDSRPKSRFPLVLIGGAVAVLLFGIIIAVVVVAGHNSGGLQLTLAPSTTNPNAAIIQITDTTIPTITLEAPTDTPVLPTATPSATTQPFTLTPIPVNTRPVPTPTHVTATPINTVSPPTALVSSVPTLQIGVQPGSPVPVSGTFASPTLLPDSQSGTYDVLTALNTLETSKITWNQDWFGPIDKGWQLGNETLKANSGPYIVRLGPDILTPLFGADAAQHVAKMDVTLQLAQYDSSLLPTGQVYFGIGFESTETGQHAAAQVTLVQANVLDLGFNVNGTVTRKTQLPISDLHFTAQRNPDKTISLYLDNKLIGQSNGAYAPNSPIAIYMFTSTGGVVVNIKALTIHLE